MPDTPPRASGASSALVVFVGPGGWSKPSPITVPAASHTAEGLHRIASGGGATVRDFGWQQTTAMDVPRQY